MLPRPYQFDGVDLFFDAARESKRLLGVAATGMGKTVLFSLIMQRFLQESSLRALVVAHREKLIFQAANKIHEVTGIEAEIEMAELRASHSSFSGSRVVIATIQTLTAGKQSRKRLFRFDPHDYGLIIVDEAHHAVAGAYIMMAEHFGQNPNAIIFGTTATPKRADKKALGQLFEKVVFNYDLQYGRDNGWLVRIKQNVVPVDALDLSKVDVVAGDFNAGQLEQQLMVEKPLLQMADATIEICCDMEQGTIERLIDAKQIDQLPGYIKRARKTIIFCASVKHAKAFAEILNRYLPGSARWICAETPREERDLLYKDYAAGRFQFLANVEVLTEGFDDPSIEVIVMARPTKSESLYIQILGRGTRPLPGVVDDPDMFAWPARRIEAIARSSKPFVEIIDFKGNAGRHRIIRTTDILGGKYPEDVRERANQIVERDGASDTDDALQRAEKEIADEVARRLEESNAKRAKIRTSTKYTRQEQDPFAVFGVTPHREESIDRAKPITDKQLEFLGRMNIPTEGLTMAQAQQLIIEVKRRRDQGLCSFGQAAILRKRHMPIDVTYADASKMIDEIAKREGWKPKPKVPRREISAPVVVRY